MGMDQVFLASIKGGALNNIPEDKSGIDSSQ